MPSKKQRKKAERAAKLAAADAEATPEDRALREEYTEAFGVHPFSKGAQMPDAELVQHLARHWVFWNLKHDDAKKRYDAGDAAALTAMQIAATSVMATRKKLETRKDLLPAVQLAVETTGYSEETRRFT